MKAHHGAPPARSSGFTLVELLVVVLILGILSAIVIPQLSTTTEHARESALASDLVRVRDAIALYAAQHRDVYPDASIVSQLMSTTDVDGSSGTRFGPYLRGHRFVHNPVDGSSAVATQATMPSAPTAAGGWIYSSSTGEFRANTPGTAPSGKAYFDL